MHHKPLKSLLVMLGVLAVLALPLIIRDRYFQHLLVLSGIFIILTSSWNLLAGYTGSDMPPFSASAVTPPPFLL